MRVPQRLAIGNISYFVKLKLVINKDIPTYLKFKISIGCRVPFQYLDELLWFLQISARNGKEAQTLQILS